MDVNLIGKTLRDDGCEGREYIIQEQIGTAGGANVYEAIHVENNYPREIVSLKVLPKTALEEWRNLDAETLRSIDDSHNSVNIVGMKSAFSSSWFACVSMEYMSEGSLRYITRETLFENGWPEDLIAIALRETLKGVSFLHWLGYVHKKINAGQIFVHWDDRDDDNNIAIKLAFGATMYDHKHCNYIQENQRNTHSSDIWSIGIMAMELACGVNGRFGHEAMIIGEIIKKKKLPSALVGQFTPAFEQVVVKSLSRDHLTADQLLQLELFRRSKDLRFFKEAVVNAKKGRW